MDLGTKLSRAWRLLLLVALLVQAVLVQTHVHPARRAPRELSTAGMTGPSAKPAPLAFSSDYCPLCWEAAAAGHFYVPPAVALPAAPATPAWIAVSIAEAFALGRAGHGWLSRAPPR